MKCDCTPYCWAIILLLSSTVSPHPAWAVDDWQHEFDAATALAKQQGKDVLIDFSGTDWCSPCRKLWEQTLSQREFIDLASKRFVLLHIDDLATEAMPEGRKERYEALQKRFAVQAFPTVVLATAEGLPYAATGLVDEINKPLAYWQHLELLHARGQKFKAALIASGGPESLTNAESIVATLAEVRPDFVVRFYSDKLEQLRKLSPSDESGYLAFIDFRTALLALEWKLHKDFLATYDKWLEKEAIKSQWVKAISPRDVDALIEKYRPQGVSLREALVARLFLEIDAGQWSQSLATLDAVGDTDAPLSRFERANFVQISIRSRNDLIKHVRAARQLRDDRVAQLRAIYAILRGDLECVTSTSCCNHSFTLQLHRIVAGAAYGELLLDSTAQLQGEARAAAIGKGLENIDLPSNGSIGRLVCEVMPGLVGKEAAKKYLPPRYADWLDK